MCGSGGHVPSARDGPDPDEDDENATVKTSSRQRDGNKRHKSGKAGSVSGVKGREWVLKKKEQMRHRGYAGIKPDTKYTGRKRKSAI